MIHQAQWLCAAILFQLAVMSQGFKVIPTIPHQSRVQRLAMSTDATQKKLPKTEAIKVRSNYLKDPLQEELKNEEIFVSPDAVVVIKYHGSYMQDDREKRKKGEEKKYQFMLRLKSPGGEIPPELYLKLDELADKYGQGDLRATTRQAWQLHGIMKGNLKTVISTIMEAGSSTVGACGDVSRNVMSSPAPFAKPEYEHMRHYTKIMAELFKPQSSAFTDLWLGDEKVAEMEYWLKDLHQAGFDVQKAMMRDTGTGIIVSDPVEPIYGQRYLPRKFKIAVTVPGDNSLDIYTNDVGLVVITDPASGELQGFNVMVGGGMGRTHMKDTTFARTADHLGYVSKEDVLELCKSIVATQRDHGNREVRPNARMKYLVHEKGIDAFRALVETYFGKKISPWKPIQPWKYQDWMGWHEQGDGKLFLGINVEQGRIKDANGVNVKKALRKIVEDFRLTMILSPTQSIIFQGISPEQKEPINQVLKAHGIKAIEDVDSLIRTSMACPAMPLCGLAVTEAERRMPDWMAQMRSLMNKVGMGHENIIMRMTGCPNGCARPYMAELGLVGDGPDSYQIWLGGSPALTNLAVTYNNKVKWDGIDAAIEPLLVFWRDSRSAGESFGEFCMRQGVDKLTQFASSFTESADATRSAMPAAGVSPSSGSSEKRPLF